MVHIPRGFANLLVGMQDESGRLPRLERVNPSLNIPTENAIVFVVTVFAITCHSIE